MMRMTRIGLILVMLCGMMVGQGLTLDQALRSALENHPGIRAEACRSESARQQSHLSLLNFFPSFQASVRWLRLDQPIVIDLNPIRTAMMQLQASNTAEFSNLYTFLNTGRFLTDDQKAQLIQQSLSGLDQRIPLFQETIKDRHYWSGQLTLVQPLWTWGKILSAYSISKLDEKIAGQERSIQQQKIMSEVVDLYFTVQLLDKVCQVKRSGWLNLRQHRDHALKMMEQGVMARVEFLKIESALEIAAADTLTTHHRFRVALHLLKNKIHRDYDVFEDSLHIPDSVPSMEFFMQKLEHDQSNLIALELTRQKLAAKKRIDWADGLPQFYGFGSYELFQQDLSTLEPEWTIGIGMKWDFLHGVDKLIQHKSNQAMISYLDFKHQELKDNLTLLVEKLYTEMLNARSNHQAMQKSHQLALENLKLHEKKFETGLGTALELQDAQLTLDRVRIGRLNEMVIYNRKLAELMALTGQLDRIGIYYRINRTE